MCLGPKGQKEYGFVDPLDRDDIFSTYTSRLRHSQDIHCHKT